MLEIKAKLVKIESNHNRLRTDEIIGSFPFEPEPGKCFYFYAEPIDKNASVRVVTTSTVQSFEKNYEKIWQFKTRNSTYQLELE